MKKISVIAALCALFLCAAISCTAIADFQIPELQEDYDGNSVYVSVNGNDQASGTNPREPVRTIQLAVSKAVELGKPYVLLREGRYIYGQGLTNMNGYTGLYLSNVSHLTVQGGWNEEFTSASGVSSLVQETNMTILMDIRKCWNIRLRNLTLEGSNTLLNAWSISNLSCENLHFTNMHDTWSSVQVSFSEDLIVKNCRFNGKTSGSVYLYISFSRDIQLDGLNMCSMNYTSLPLITFSFTTNTKLINSVLTNNNMVIAVYLTNHRGQLVISNNIIGSPTMAGANLISVENENHLSGMVLYGNVFLTNNVLKIYSCNDNLGYYSITPDNSGYFWTNLNNAVLLDSTLAAGNTVQ